MNVRTGATGLEARSCYPLDGSPLWRPISPELLWAVNALLARNPDLAEATLEEVRVALEDTSLLSSGSGEPSYAPRTALIDELDRLTQIVGCDASAADLFPSERGRDGPGWH